MWSQHTLPDGGPGSSRPTAGWGPGSRRLLAGRSPVASHIAVYAGATATPRAPRAPPSPRGGRRLKCPRTRVVCITRSHSGTCAGRGGRKRPRVYREITGSRAVTPPRPAGRQPNHHPRRRRKRLSVDHLRARRGGPEPDAVRVGPAPVVRDVLFGVIKNHDYDPRDPHSRVARDARSGAHDAIRARLAGLTCRGVARRPYCRTRDRRS
jgi:hypothetical protein